MDIEVIKGIESMGGNLGYQGYQVQQGIKVIKNIGNYLSLDILDPLISPKT